MRGDKGMAGEAEVEGTEPVGPVRGDHARVVLEALDAWLRTEPESLPHAAKAEALARIQQIKAKTAALELKVLGSAADAARAAGHRDAAAWYAATTRTDVGVARSTHRAARSLQDAPQVAQALEAGAVSERHARSILDTLEHLPAVTRGLRDKAEERLLAHARRLPPKQLVARGKGILDEVDPGGDHRQLGATLADEARRAWAMTRVSFHDHLDGTTGVEGLLPTPVAVRVKTVLDAYASPRGPGRHGAAPSVAGPDARAWATRASDGGMSDGGTSDGGASDGGASDGSASITGAPAATESDGGAAGHEAPVAYATRLGHALCRVLEGLDPAALPRHGGAATTLVVTIDRSELVSELGVAGIVDPDGTALSASEARRLACGAAIVPAVLGSRSQVLDLGRTSRLFTPSQVLALRTRHGHCQAEGCTIPAAWCEAHHLDPWSRGGKTDLANGALLCSHHHHRVHDPAYRHERGPDGGIRLRLTSPADHPRGGTTAPTTSRPSGGATPATADSLPGGATLATASRPPGSQNVPTGPATSNPPGRQPTSVASRSSSVSRRTITRAAPSFTATTGGRATRL